MSEANKTQVGGTHYAGAYQHWDLVVAAGLNYFEGQITKYVLRHRFKNGLQDLQKAAHFLQKYKEVYATMLEGCPPSERRHAALEAFVQSYVGTPRELAPEEVSIVCDMCLLSMPYARGKLQRVEEKIAALIAGLDGSAATAAYVNQDR